MKPIPERQDVGADTFEREIRGAGRPAVLRGLVAHWPAVAEARRSAAALAAYLKGFGAAAPAEALVGPPEIGGHLFYRDDMSGLNFSRSRGRIGDILDGLVELEHEARPPAVSIQSLKTADALPGFEGANPLPLPIAGAEPRLWIGNRVTVAPHFDLYENVACVVAGRRRFTLFPPDQLPNLYVGPFDFSPAGAPVSMVDSRSPDFERYPRYREALEHAETAELEPGDAIYMPYMWWHGVESLAPFNMLVNYWWNDARPSASPFDLLMHAMIVLRDMPPEQRSIWRGMLDHYVFETNGPPLDHLAPAHRGALGGLDDAGKQAMKAMLAGRLAGRRP